MPKAKKNWSTELDKIKKKSKPPIAQPVSVRPYDENDILKQYIREQYWAKRIHSLKSDTDRSGGIKYFSLCAKSAYDIRYFIKHNLIDLELSTPFAFVEMDKRDYDFLKNWFLTKHPYSLGDGFPGKLADIATDSANQNYGKFWGTFPYDVLNLDFLGDIFKSVNHESRILGANDFYAIQAIISKQSFHTKPYDLWITYRTKTGKYEYSIKEAFHNIIKNNIQGHEGFAVKYKLKFSNEEPDSIDEDQMFTIGFYKWLWYVCRKSDSIINASKSQIIKYERFDSEGNSYFLNNIFLRIQPYEIITIPSPVSEAAKRCEREYKKGIVNCLDEPIDIMEEYNQLDSAYKANLKKELDELAEEYKEDQKGWLG